MPIVVGALLLNFYDPIKLAEDMIVLDIVSGGRVSHVIGLGYRPEEYAMFGIAMSDRGKVIDGKLAALQRALRGEEFEYEGRSVKVTPPALTPGGPRLAYGGHSLAAARRAGRMGLDMFAEGSRDNLLETYQQAARDAGHEPGMALIPDGNTPTSVFVAEDLDDAWAKIGPHMLYDATIYRGWMGDNTLASSRSESTTVEQMRAENGAYRILTPDQAIAQAKSGVPLLSAPAVRRLSARVRMGELAPRGRTRHACTQVTPSSTTNSVAFDIGVGIGLEAIPHTRFGDEVARAPRVGFELASDVCEVHPQQIPRRVRRSAPKRRRRVAAASPVAAGDASGARRSPTRSGSSGWVRYRYRSPCAPNDRASSSTSRRSPLAGQGSNGVAPLAGARSSSSIPKGLVT